MGYLCSNLRAVRLRAGASPKAAFSAVTFRHVSCRLASSLHAPSSLSPSWSPKSPHTPPASSPKGLLFRLCATLEAVTLAIELGVDVNAANTDGRTALDAAMNLDYQTVVDFLVKNGAKHGTGPDESPQ